MVQGNMDDPQSYSDHLQGQEAVYLNADGEPVVRRPLTWPVVDV